MNQNYCKFALLDKINLQSICGWPYTFGIDTTNSEPTMRGSNSNVTIFSPI